MSVELNNRNNFIIEKPIKIQGITIEQFCKEQHIDNIDLIHIDVEGHAIQVLQGLGYIRPKIIYIEVRSDTHDHANEITSLLNEKNFKKLGTNGTDEIWLAN